MVTLPERTNVVPLSLEQDSSVQSPTPLPKRPVEGWTTAAAGVGRGGI